MTKYVTTYQINALGEIEKIQMVDGVLIQEDGGDQRDAWDNFLSFLSPDGVTAEGAEWETRRIRKPYSDNGREYNFDIGDWEYVVENGSVNQFDANYECAWDYQGAVPVWDGYNGK